MRSYFVHLNKLYLGQALKKKHYNFSPFLLQQRNMFRYLTFSLNYRREKNYLKKKKKN